MTTNIQMFFRYLSTNKVLKACFEKLCLGETITNWKRYEQIFCCLASIVPFLVSNVCYLISLFPSFLLALLPCVLCWICFFTRVTHMLDLLLVACCYCLHWLLVWVVFLTGLFPLFVSLVYLFVFLLSCFGCCLLVFLNCRLACVLFL